MLAVDWYQVIRFEVAETRYKVGLYLPYLETAGINWTVASGALSLEAATARAAELNAADSQGAR